MANAITANTLAEAATPTRGIQEAVKKALTSIVLITLVAFGARLAFAVNQTLKIPAAALTTASFYQETGSIAASLAAHKGFSNPLPKDTGPTAWLAPVYPLLVAASFKLFGIRSLHSFYFLVFLNILFASAVCVPIYLVGKRVQSIAAGSIAAWLWALFPGAIMIPFEWIWDTSLSVLLSVVILWTTLEIADSRKWRDWCAYGLLWGFALMTNPALGSLLPFLLGWSAYRARKGAQLRLSAALSRAVAAAGLTILCCVPWTIRNYTVFHRFIPFRSNFPFELYIGNNENYATEHPRFPAPFTKEREMVRFVHMGEIPFMDEEMRKAKLFIQFHPRKALQLCGYRFAAFWLGAPFALNTFLTADFWLARAVLLCATLSGIGALAGIVVLLWSRNPFAFPLAAYPVAFPLVYYITHTSLRYRHPIDPVVLLLTAIAATATFASAAKHFRKNAVA
jgi:Dolichyl-phosphate-mannose-protein mannosyltransferase